MHSIHIRNRASGVNLCASKMIEWKFTHSGAVNKYSRNDVDVLWFIPRCSFPIQNNDRCIDDIAHFSRSLTLPIIMFSVFFLLWFFSHFSLYYVFFVLFLISCMIHTYYFILSAALMLKSTKIYNPTFAVIKKYSNFFFLPYPTFY